MRIALRLAIGSIFFSAFTMQALQDGSHTHQDGKLAVDPAWPELNSGMEKMLGS